MLKIGLIGCGKIAEKHIQAYKKIGNISLIATDIALHNKAIADRYHLGWVNEASDLFNDPDISIIDICTPTPTHFSLIMQALESNKHVISEKPLVTCKEEATLIKNLALQKNKLVFTAYPYRFHPGFSLAKKILEENVIGTPYYALFRLGGRGSHQVWKHQKNSGGGAINEMLVHMLDLIYWYFGNIVHLNNLTTKTLLNSRVINGNVQPANAEDLVLLGLKSENEVEIICQSDLITPSYMNYIEIHGSHGSLFTSIMNILPTLVFCNEARGEFKAGQNILQFEQVDLFEKELTHFIKGISCSSALSDFMESSVAIANLLENININD